MKISKEEKLDAARRLHAGESKRSVSHDTGIDRKSLSTYLARYQKEGEEAFGKQRIFSVEKKQECVKKILEKGTDINIVSSDEGIPSTTLKRWIKAYQLHGPEGLITKREMEASRKEKEREEEARYDRDSRLVGEVIHSTLSTYEEVGNDFGQSIPQKLKELGAFTNPAFGSFLLNYFRTFQTFLEQKKYRTIDGWTEEAFSIAYATAKMAVAMIPFDCAIRKDTESLLAEDVTQIFLQQFAEEIPMVLWQESLNEIIPAIEN